MRRIHRRLTVAELEPDEGAHARLPGTDDPELQRLARSIIAEQEREIRILERV